MIMRRLLVALTFLVCSPLIAGAHSLSLSENVTQPCAQSCAETVVALGNVNTRIGADFSGFLSLNALASMPKREVMRRDPPGLARIALAPLLPFFRDLSMRFNKFRASGVPTVVLAISSMIAGCGGGGSTDAETQASVTSTSNSAGMDVGITQSSSASSVGSTADVPSDAQSTASTVDTSSLLSVASADPAPVAVSAESAQSSGGITTTSATAATSRSGVGTNLNQISYFSPEFPTIDFMKRASSWLTQCSPYVNKDCKSQPWDSGEEAQLDMDANGYVKSLPATGSPSIYRYVSTVVTSGGTQPAGKYIVLYDGQGTLSYSGTATKVAGESSPGRDVVSVTNGTGPFLLSVLATTPSNYIHNIRIYAPGGACSGDLTTWVTSATACTSAKGTYVAFENFPAGSTWFPTFLNGVKGFRTLRFMDWGQTNLTKVTTWAGRTSPTYRVWSGNPGVPVEAMFDLAKTAGADPWMNIPPYVDDDYIHEFGKLAHHNLGVGQTLNLEYGNEMWNYGFPATVWSVAQAKMAFASSLAKGVDATTLTVNWYAQRLVQACNIVKGEFGADASRVRCIANTQASNAWDTSQVLSCPYAGGACAKSIDAVAIAPYFGQYISNSANRTLVKSWYADADGGLTKMFAEIVGTDAAGVSASTLTPLAATSSVQGGALNQIKGWMVATKAVTAKYGIPMWAYEGGQGLVQSSNDTDQNLLKLMIAANRDARMGAAYQTMMQDWVAAGGQTFSFYTDMTPASKYGFWGLRESQFDTAANAPKWKAALQWRDSTPCWWSGC